MNAEDKVVLFTNARRRVTRTAWHAHDGNESCKRRGRVNVGWSALDKGYGSAMQLGGVLETVLYYAADEDAEIRRFYVDVLGMRAVGEGLGFRVGSSLLLFFDREQSTVQSKPPPHGSRGPIHTCFTTDPDEYDAWKARLADNDVAIIDEIGWPNGVKSFYFHDPAGNLLEIADGDMWPTT